VIFAGREDGSPPCRAHVSEDCCRRRLPGAAAAVHCDVMRLLDIRHHTTVDAPAVLSAQGWATVPFALPAHAPRARGRPTTGERRRPDGPTRAWNTWCSTSF
jgi:hypothetical protein